MEFDIVTTINGLKPGTILTNKEISRIFKCPIEGGMRRSLKTNSLVLVTNPIQSAYTKQWDGQRLNFIGMGKVGDQTLERQNKTLYNMDSNGVKIYYFNLLEKTKYIYIGQMVKAGAPYKKKQKDSNGRLRSVWIFPLKLKD